MPQSATLLSRRAIAAAAIALLWTTPASGLTLLTVPYEMTPSGRLIRVDPVPEPLVKPVAEPVPWTDINATLVLDQPFETDSDEILGGLGRLGRDVARGRRSVRFAVVARDFNLEAARRPTFDDRSRDAALPAIQARLTIQF